MLQCVHEALLKGTEEYISKCGLSTSDLSFNPGMLYSHTYISPDTGVCVPRTVMGD